MVHGPVGELDPVMMLLQNPDFLLNLCHLPTWLQGFGKPIPSCLGPGSWSRRPRPSKTTRSRQPCPTLDLKTGFKEKSKSFRQSFRMDSD